MRAQNDELCSRPLFDDLPGQRKENSDFQGLREGTSMVKWAESFRSARGGEFGKRVNGGEGSAAKRAYLPRPELDA